MSASFEKCSLYLHPDKSSTLKISSLISELERIGFIDNLINDKHFHVGEKYLNFIAYMGCAPNIQFETSNDNKKFCSIRLHHHEKKQLIVSKTQVKAPQCPECKKPVKNWKEKMTDSTLLCENCHTTANIEEYNWRKMGGFSQLFIEITDIFPKEAIPQQLLLDKLSNLTHTKWQYFYSCQ